MYQVWGKPLEAFGRTRFQALLPTFRGEADAHGDNWFSQHSYPGHENLVAPPGNPTIPPRGTQELVVAVLHVFPGVYV